MVAQPAPATHPPDMQVSAAARRLMEPSALAHMAASPAFRTADDPAAQECVATSVLIGFEYVGGGGMRPAAVACDRLPRRQPDQAE
jgi:hypothetical protein